MALYSRDAVTVSAAVATRSRADCSSMEGHTSLSTAVVPKTNHCITTNSIDNFFIVQIIQYLIDYKDNYYNKASHSKDYNYSVTEQFRFACTILLLCIYLKVLHVWVKRHNQTQHK